MSANSVMYFGVVYDSETDWRSFLSKALKGHIYEGLNLDRHFGLSMPNALGALSDALRGTPMEIGLADAGLEILERGNEEEMEIVESTRWAKAPGAFERILAFMQHRPHAISPAWLVRLYGELLPLGPTDSRLLGLLDRDASRPDASPSLLSLAARYNIDWLSKHLRTLHRQPSQDMWEWLTYAGVGAKAPSDVDRAALAENRAHVVATIAELGEPYIRALIDQVSELPLRIKQELTDALQAHPAFARLM